MEESDEGRILPRGYRWADSPGRSTLYLRYGWVATVTETTVKVGSTGPYHPVTAGPCRGIAHGKRTVERLLAVRLCLGPPARAEYRRRLLKAKVDRALGPPALVEPDGDQELAS